jgi:hypothetical protein
MHLVLPPVDMVPARRAEGMHLMHRIPAQGAAAMAHANEALATRTATR